jgi:RHS repeat-associated protein
MSLGEGPPIGYSEVTILHGANGEYGRTAYRFRSVLNVGDDMPSPPAWPYSTRTSYEWKRSQPISQAESNASQQLQQRNGFSYQFRDVNSPDTMTTRKFRGISVNSFSGGFFGSTYSYHPFEVISAWAYQDADTTFSYNETGSSSFSTVKTYTYGNPVHVQPTEVTETNSNGTQRITRMKYPADYASGSGNAEATAITAMKGVAHIHSAVIEKWVTEKIGTTQKAVQAELTSFKTYAAGQYMPYQIFAFNSAAPVTNFSPSTISGSFTKDSRYLHQETAVTYDAYGRITALDDARSKRTNFLYGGNPNNAFVTKITRVKGTGDPVDLVTDLAYNGNGYLFSIKDEGGTFRYFIYDSFGRLFQEQNHGSTTLRQYDYQYSRTSGNGWTFSASSPNMIVETAYLQHTPSVKSVTTRLYTDGLGRQIQTNLQDGSNYYVTATQYDLPGREWRIWRPYVRSTYTYDPSFATNATSYYNTYHGVSNAKPYREIHYTADVLARPKKEVPEFFGTTATAFTQYDYGVDPTPKHAYIETTDPSGKKKRSFTDVFGNELKTILGYGATEATTTNLAYNILGQRIQLTDPRGIVTNYTIDTRGLLTTRANPDAGTIEHQYDQNGNLRYTQDAVLKSSGLVLFHIYDFASRPTHTGVGSATFSSLDPNVLALFEQGHGTWREIRQYDVKPDVGYFPWNLFTAEINGTTLQNTAGRLTAVASKSNNAWQLKLHSYDADGRVSMMRTFTQANGGGMLTALNTTTTYERDLRGEVTKRSVTVGSSPFHHWYDYDNRGLLWKVFASTSSTKPATADATYTYAPDGQPKDRQYLGGPLVPFRYTVRGQLEKIGDPASTAYPFSARYAYHANGNVSESEFYNAGTPIAPPRYRYLYPTYDALNRLKSADYAYWNGSGWTSTSAFDLSGINYDAAGNLMALHRRGYNTAVIDNLSYSYLAGYNRLGSLADAVGPLVYTWDAESGSFTYDANGNMKTAPDPYLITAATYDHMNLPLTFTRSGTAIKYRYDGGGQRIAKQVGTGDTEVYLTEGPTTLAVYTVNSSGTPTAWHFNVISGDQVVGRQPNTGSRSYYHRDLLGSTRSVVQGTNIVESYDYDPWGQFMKDRWLEGPTKERFSGKERDAETGLDYFGFRYYMPAVGRWTSVDPPADEFPSWSPYNYVENNPVTFTDRHGLCAVDADGIDYTYDICGNVVDQTANGLEQDRHFVDIEGEKLSLDQPLTAGDTPYEVYDEAVFDNLTRSLAHQLPDVGGHDVRDYILQNFLASSEGGTLDTKHQMPERALWKTGNGAAVHRDKVGNAVWAHYYKHRRYPLAVLLLGARMQGKFATPSGREDPLDQVYIRRGYTIKP